MTLYAPVETHCAIDGVRRNVAPVSVKCTCMVARVRNRSERRVAAWGGGLGGDLPMAGLNHACLKERQDTTRAERAAPPGSERPPGSSA